MAKQMNITAADSVDTLKDSVVPVSPPPGRIEIPSPRVSDDVQRRQLAQQLQKIYWLQAYVVNEVDSKYMHSTDLVGISNLMSTFYQACEREHQSAIDFKSKGIGGYGHSLTDSEVITVARSLVMMFGPEFLLDTDQKKLFFDTLKASVQDIAETISPTIP